MYHANLFGLLVGKMAGVPYIAWGIRSCNERLTSYRCTTRWVVRLGAWLSRLPDVIIVNSEAGKRVHENWGYDKSKTMVISNGFDLEAFKPDPAARRSVRTELGVGDNQFLIGLIARFHAMKDHATFFTAASLLGRRHPEIHFLLAGSGVSPENHEVARMARENGLAGFVHLLGSRYDISRLTAALDIACLSSWSEAFPNVVGEAMACGVPCVVTDVGDSAYIVGDTGRVVARRNPKALAAACVELIEMGAAERQALGQKARKRIEERFSLANMVRAYESVYESLQNCVGS